VIPLPQLAGRAEELSRLLREIKGRSAPSAQLAQLERDLRDHGTELRQKAQDTDALIATIPSLFELKELERSWRARVTAFDSDRKTLTRRATMLEADIQALARQHELWAATLNGVGDADALEAVFDRLRDAVADLQSTQAQAQEQLNLMLILQNRVSQQDEIARLALEKIEYAWGLYQNRLLVRDSPPLWRAWSAPQPEDPLRRLTRGSLLSDRRDVEGLVQAVARPVFLIFILFWVILLAAYAVKRRLEAAPGQAVLGEGAGIFSRPVSVALLLSLLCLQLLAAAAPPVIVGFIGLLLLAPALRVLGPIVAPAYRPLLFAIGVIYLMFQFRNLAGLSTVVRRGGHVLIGGVALVVVTWLARRGRLEYTRAKGRRAPLAVMGIRAALVICAVALAANVFGYVALSQVLNEAVLLSAYLAVALYAAHRVLVAAFELLVGGSRFGALSVIGRRRGEIDRWGRRVIGAGALTAWALGSLNFFGIRGPVLAAVSSFLTTPVRLESIEISIWDVISFFLVLGAGYLFSNLARFTLSEGVFPRLSLERGLPNAISTSVYYVILFLSFIMALAAAGVDLSRFTLLTGALGVGIGFGLQNIVNNFVSGLILMFERPVRIGDTVEVGGLTGDVLRIGIRSCTVLTGQGAEVIVPNGELVANRVINWTLSSRRRRVDIPVGVAHGTDPARVLGLLAGVAESHPGVLRSPPPMVVFQSFGENSLNFELRCWAPESGTAGQLQSDLTVAVAAALASAGIQIPYPQRVVHIQGANAAAKEDSRAGLAEEIKS